MGVAEPCRASSSSSFVVVVQPRLLAAVALRTPGGVCLIFRFRVKIAPLAAVSPFGRDEVVHLHTPQDSSYTSVLTYPIELSSSHSLSSRFFPTARLHLQDRPPSYHTLGVLVLYTLPKVLLHGSGRGRSAVHMAQDYCKPQWRSPTSVGRRAEMSSHPSHSASSSPHPSACRQTGYAGHLFMASRYKLTQPSLLCSNLFSLFLHPLAALTSLSPSPSQPHIRDLVLSSNSFVKVT